MALLLALALLLLAAPALATEALCPGGAAPRTDITFCVDFETTTDCTTGYEGLCWYNQGFNTGLTTEWQVRQGRTDTVIGSGYAHHVGTPGDSGAGSGPMREPLQGSRFNNITWRYYVRYSGGYLGMPSGHGSSAVASTDPAAIIAAFKFQTSSFSGELHYDGIAACGGGLNSFTLGPNQGNWTPLLSNRWYRIEMQMLLDTSCSDHGTTPWSGCNGVIRTWKDGILTHKYTGLNLGGVQCGLSWYEMGPLSHYYHYAFPPWGGTTDIDQIVVSNMTDITPSDTEVIGAAVGAGAAGTGDPSSPYANILSYEAWLGRHTGDDCTSNGYLGPYVAKQYRSGGTLETAVTHGRFTDRCTQAIDWIPGNLATPTTGTLLRVNDGTGPTDCTDGGGATSHMCVYNGAAWVATSATDNALRVRLTSDSAGGGVAWLRQSDYAFPQWANYGWLYVPAGQTFTSVLLSGFVDDQVEASPAHLATRYVGIAINSGNWAVTHVDGGGSATYATSTAVTYDAWHEYELIVWNTQEVTLMVDRVRLLDHAAMSRSVAWLFTGPYPTSVVGVLDFQGTQPFTVYFDDNGIASASFWACDGWGAASCPFATGVSLGPGVRIGAGIGVR